MKKYDSLFLAVDLPKENFLEPFFFHLNDHIRVPLTFIQTHNDNGKVMTTKNHDIIVSIQPQHPSPSDAPSSAEMKIIFKINY